MPLTLSSSSFLITVFIDTNISFLIRSVLIILAILTKKKKLNYTHAITNEPTKPDMNNLMKTQKKENK